MGRDVCHGGVRLVHRAACVGHNIHSNRREEYKKANVFSSCGCSVPLQSLRAGGGEKG